MTDDAAEGQATDETTVDADTETDSADGAQDTRTSDAVLAEMATGEAADAEAMVESEVNLNATSETGQAAEITEADGAMTETVDAEAVEIETEQGAETDEMVDLAEAGEADREAAAENNAAAVQAATSVVGNVDQSEVATEETAEIAVDSSTPAGPTTEGAAEDVEGVVVQTDSGGTSDAEAGDQAEDVAEGANDGESADQSNTDAEQSPQDQSGEQQVEGAETADAPLVAGPQVTNAQGTAQTGAPTNVVTGVGPVAGTGEVGPSTANQVAGTAPAEQADAADPLWRQVRRAMGSIRNLPTGEQQLTIRLRPDDLGSVVVRISTGEAGTTVALVADSAVAANQLTQQRQQLIRELEDGGLRGVAVDVGTSGDTQQGDGDGDETEMSQTNGTIGGTTADGADGDPVLAYGERRAGRTTEGLIDVDL
jgi:flagellar hook-length control protein FliK